MADVQVRVPGLVGVDQLIPGDLALRVGRGARKHGRQRRLDAGCKLVVKFVGCDAFDECLVLFRIGLGEVVGE